MDKEHGVKWRYSCKIRIINMENENFNNHIYQKGHSDGSKKKQEGKREGGW